MALVAGEWTKGNEMRETESKGTEVTPDHVGPQRPLLGDWILFL